MSLTLPQIVARLEDPEVPVVWLDPTTPEQFWNDLPEALIARGLAVLNLEGGSPISDHDSLLERFSEILDCPGDLPHSLPALRDCLLKLPHRGPRGWVVIFRRPELLRQNDEATFEDLLEALELVHESQFEIHHRVFKLVVRD